MTLRHSLLMGEGKGGRRLRLRPRGASAPEGEPLARRGVNHFFFPLTFTLLDMVFYSALLSRKRSIEQGESSPLPSPKRLRAGRHQGRGEYFIIF